MHYNFDAHVRVVAPNELGIAYLNQIQNTIQTPFQKDLSVAGSSLGSIAPAVSAFTAWPPRDARSRRQSDPSRS